MKVILKFSGFDELAKKLAEMPDAVSGAARIAALTKGAEPIRADAARLVARSPDAPHIAENMVIGELRDGSGVAVGPARHRGVAYALPFELGTVKMPARPFLRPAFDTQMDTAAKITGEEFWKQIKEKAES